ncbi:polymer-forming cytoskeletal protein [Flavobacteriales bacterium]|jgi:cytoskeletal protein CcmA (bactofilin family)|nr:polymer-forming cytoskeletal protein [Flavobacteriales bacterium]
MFKNSKSEEMSSPQSFDTNAIDRIAEGTTLEGSVNSAKSIRVDGKVKGSIVCAGRVVIGKTGVVEGKVDCDSADVEGTLNATITVTGLLELKTTAVINGDSQVGKLKVDPGAEINGKIDMGGTLKSISNNKSETVVEKTA